MKPSGPGLLFVGRFLITVSITLLVISVYISFFFFLKKFTFFYLFIYLWLCWVFVSVWGLSPVAASGDHSSSRCAGLPPSRPLLMRSTGSRRAGSVIVAHGPSCSVACGIFPDRGSNPCPCIGRQILNHCTTREARVYISNSSWFNLGILNLYKNLSFSSWLFILLAYSCLY